MEPTSAGALRNSSAPAIPCATISGLKCSSSWNVHAFGPASIGGGTLQEVSTVINVVPAWMNQANDQCQLMCAPYLTMHTSVAAHIRGSVHNRVNKRSPSCCSLDMFSVTTSPHRICGAAQPPQRSLGMATRMRRMRDCPTRRRMPSHTRQPVAASRAPQDALGHPPHTPRIPAGAWRRRNWGAGEFDGELLGSAQLPLLHRYAARLKDCRLTP